MASFLILALSLAPAAGPVSFSRDILPILSDKCLACHGPDASARKAGLRLDDAESARANGAVVPGKPEDSEVLRRVLSTDPQEVMPPPKTGKTVSPRERELLRAWIAAGAKFERHWAFTRVERPPVPAVADKARVRNPVDAFVQARLQRDKVLPSSMAPPHVLARRLSLDLTGLPPSAELVRRLSADSSHAAVRAAASTLMNTDAFAERMAWDWLDAARYADTDGFQGDAERTNWPWRDWVVSAYRSNMPFDRFTLEQCAGDLLPGAKPEQVLAALDHVGLPVGEGVDERVQIPPVGEAAVKSYELYSESRHTAETLSFAELAASPLMVCGDVDAATEKLISTIKEYGFDEMLCWTRIGGLEPRKVMRSMELMSGRVMPAVRKAMEPPRMAAE